MRNRYRLAVYAGIAFLNWWAHTQRPQESARDRAGLVGSPW